MFNKTSHSTSSVPQLSHWNGGITHALSCARRRTRSTRDPLISPKGNCVSTSNWQSFHCSSVSTAGQRETWRNREIYTFSSQLGWFSELEFTAAWFTALLIFTWIEITEIQLFCVFFYCSSSSDNWKGKQCGLIKHWEFSVEFALYERVLDSCLNQIQFDCGEWAASCVTISNLDFLKWPLFSQSLKFKWTINYMQSDGKRQHSAKTTNSITVFLNFSVWFSKAPKKSSKEQQDGGCWKYHGGTAKTIQ